MVGIPTVLITVDRQQSEMARLSRALCPKRFKLGNSLGAPHQEKLHIKVLEDALKLLSAPLVPGVAVEVEYPEYNGGDSGY